MRSVIYKEQVQSSKIHDQNQQDQNETQNDLNEPLIKLGLNET